MQQPTEFTAEKDSQSAIRVDSWKGQSAIELTIQKDSHPYSWQYKKTVSHRVDSWEGQSAIEFTVQKDSQPQSWSLKQESQPVDSWKGQPATELIA